VISKSAIIILWAAIIRKKSQMREYPVKIIFIDEVVTVTRVLYSASDIEKRLKEN
jgi:hypothetical protein